MTCSELTFCRDIPSHEKILIPGIKIPRLKKNPIFSGFSNQNPDSRDYGILYSEFFRGFQIPIPIPGISDSFTGDFLGIFKSRSGSSGFFDLVQNKNPDPESPCFNSKTIIILGHLSVCQPSDTGLLFHHINYQNIEKIYVF